MRSTVDRRRFLTWFAASGFTVLLAPRVLAQDPELVSEAAIAKAESLSGLTFDDEERALMAKGVTEHLQNYEELRKVAVANDVPPAFLFRPLPAGQTAPPDDLPFRSGSANARTITAEGEEVAFLSVLELGALLRAGRISSVELTRLYLDRLRRYDEALQCVISLTEESALQQAERADRELRRGIDRGPLQGIPWGAKDLIATPEARTTWGAMPYKDQVLDVTATVAQKLDEAGAVLVAKLTVGALAWGDVWYGGTTKNPWNLEQGSSGSSAGPAAATAAGLVGFSIGTETLGSIISPSQRCGATGLRPTFGRVSRYGVMALSWTMDKVGPICRSSQDCALVLEAIRGRDGKDEAVIDAGFGWNAGRNPLSLRVGYDAAAFEEESDDSALDQAALATLRRMGYELVPVRLPELPVGDMLFILEAEAAAAFDDLTRSDRDDLLVRQIDEAWPNVFRTARFIPAVEYIQANRVRTILMQQYQDAIAEVDAYVHPTYGGSTLLIANLTGQPSVVVPHGFREDGTPASITFTGQLFGEADLLTVSMAFQNETGDHRRRPPGFL